MSPKQLFTLLPVHLLFFVFLFNAFVFSYKHVCNHQDQSALLAFSINISPSSSLPLNWSSHTSCCRWEGIQCDINGRVTHLQLPSKGLQGVITSSIVTLTSLKILDLSSNRNIHGSIPQEIGKLLYLEMLLLDENNLSGSIPLSLLNCTHLVEIHLRGNNLDGDISKLDFSRLVELQKLDLRDNSLNGSLPESIYSCKSLIAIGLARNNITGQISPKIIDLKSLSFVSLSGNRLTNITSTLRVLAKCKNLTSLYLSSNFQGESLPIHESFLRLGEFTKLQFLELGNSKFAPGPIPNWLSNLKSLWYLNIEGNQMKGRVPSWLGTLPNLFTLYLNDNSLYGELPVELCQLPALISQNVQEDLKFSRFELPVIPEPGYIIQYKVNYYHGLDLSNNELSGIIPKEIGNLQNLQELFLQNNSFSGHIPISISNLRKMEILDLSRNNLTGEIPASLGSLSFLGTFNVSYNNLEGPIPYSGQLSTFEEPSFEGNSGLCGKPLNRPCSHSTASEASDGSRRHGKKKRFLDGLFVGFSSGFSSVLIVVASFVCFYKRRRPSWRGEVN